MEVYEVEEQKRDYVVKGISDKVSRYSYCDMKLPAIKLVCETKNPVVYKLRVLNSMLIGQNTELYTGDARVINVYLRCIDGNTLELGRVMQSQIRSIINMFMDECKLEAYMENGTLLEGNMVYAMCC